MYLLCLILLALVIILKNFIADAKLFNFVDGQMLCGSKFINR